MGIVDFASWFRLNQYQLFVAPLLYLPGISGAKSKCVSYFWSYQELCHLFRVQSANFSILSSLFWNSSQWGRDGRSSRIFGGR